MKTYDISYLVNSQWTPAEQAVALSRRRLMARLRDNPDYSHGFDAKRKPMAVGKHHGKCKVSLAS